MRAIVVDVTSIATILGYMRVGALEFEVAHFLTILTLDTRHYHILAMLSYQPSSSSSLRTYYHGAWSTPFRCDRTRRSFGTASYEAQCTPWPCGPRHRNCDRGEAQQWDSPLKNGPLYHMLARMDNL